MAKGAQVEVESYVRPGKTRHVDAALYRGMKAAWLKVVPKAAPGLTLAEIHARLPAHLPENLFPRGNKGGWWAKTVQLDLEAKGILIRDGGRPLRIRRR